MRVIQLIGFAAFLVLGGSGCHGFHSDSLQYVEQYVGKDPAASGLWETEPLQSTLKELTGERYGQFSKYMQRAGILTKDTYLYSLARLSGDTTKGYAFVLIDPEKSKMMAAIISNVQIEKFQSPGEQFVIPPVIENKIDSLLNTPAN